MAEFVGAKHAVFCSSGSTANTILAYYAKEKYPDVKQVILPSVTWQTSCSPWIHSGFEPIFVDVSLKDFAIDLDALDRKLASFKKRCIVFPTALLGFPPDMDKLIRICRKHGAVLMMDNCENMLSKIPTNLGLKNSCSQITCSASCYMGHQVCSIEGGFLFTNSEDEYLHFLMLRNHGMVRSLDSKHFPRFANADVDHRFDFNLLGNNFRNTEINALTGILDLKRAEKYSTTRIKMFERFVRGLDPDVFWTPMFLTGRHCVPFALPVLFLEQDKSDKVSQLKEKLGARGIETRPIISGNLLRQTAYKKFGDWKDFHKAELIHKNGFYVGLHPKVKFRDIDELLDLIHE